MKLLKSKPSEANQHNTETLPKNQAETKAAHERKLKPTKHKTPLPLKPACEDLKFLRQNIPKKNNNEIT